MRFFTFFEPGNGERLLSRKRSSSVGLASSAAADLHRTTRDTARLYRALNNHFEGLILFTLAVVVVTLGGAASPLTAACAWIYLIARVAYVPAYWLGLTPWRSIIWVVGFAATVVMLLAALFSGAGA